MYCCFTGVHTMAQLVAITDRFLPASRWHNCAVCSSMWLSRATCSKYAFLTYFLLQLSCMSWSQCPTSSLGQGPHLQPQSMAAVVWLVGAFFAKMIGRCFNVHCECVYLCKKSLVLYRPRCLRAMMQVGRCRQVPHRILSHRLDSSASHLVSCTGIQLKRVWWNSYICDKPLLIESI